MVKRVFATLSVAVILTALSAGASASADTVLSGPVNLGTAANYGALAGSTVTNANNPTISGLVGVYPGSAITGFPPGLATGLQAATAVERDAQADLTIAYGVASSLTPTATGLGDLAGQTLVPGVYQGNVLSLTGDVTLSGSSTSVWVFQADSALTIASGARVLLSPGVSACNVFWKVGSSATINTGAEFVGTVLADQAIFARNGASIEGRLLARIAEVTLDNNDITVPSGCSSAGVVSSSPVVTSSSPVAASLGRPYSFSVVVTSSPTASFAVDSGSLPAGLTLSSTGVISGTPTALGTSSVVLRASNGIAADTLVTYALTVSPAALAATGLADTALPLAAAAIALIALGLLLGRRRKLRTP